VRSRLSFFSLGTGGLHLPQRPPCFAQYLQLLQFLHAVQFAVPVHAPEYAGVKQANTSTKTTMYFIPLIQMVIQIQHIKMAFREHRQDALQPIDIKSNQQ
jgi:hypothetical protein